MTKNTGTSKKIFVQVRPEDLVGVSQQALADEIMRCNAEIDRLKASTPPLDVRKYKQELDEKIKEFESDERLHVGTATIQVNAPLALVQVDLKAKLMALRWARSRLEDVS